MKRVSRRYLILGVLIIIAIGALIVAIVLQLKDDQPVYRPGGISSDEKQAAVQELETWDANNILKSTATPQEKYEYYALRTRSLSSAGNFQEAVDEFKKAELTGVDVRYSLYAEAGAAYEALGDRSNARESYQKSITAAERQLTGDSKTYTVLSLQGNMERMQ